MDGPRNIGKVLRSMQTMEGAGVRLRANLPASRKMMDPRYRGVKAGDIPVVEQEGGARVRVISGEVDGTTGPVREIVTEPVT